MSSQALCFTASDVGLRAKMNRKLIIILGPTAVGKTDSSIETALKYGSPIIY